MAPTQTKPPFDPPFSPLITGFIGMIPVGQRMTDGGALAMQYAQVTIRTVTIDGVEIVQGTLIAICEAEGDVGGGGGLGGGGPTQPSETNQNASGSAELTTETESKILEGAWRLADEVNGEFIGGHPARIIQDPRVIVDYEWLPTAVPESAQGVRAFKIKVTRPNGIPKAEGKPSEPHATSQSHGRTVRVSPPSKKSRRQMLR